MPRTVRLRSTIEPFVEKDFYLEQFRGRTVLIAVAPAAAADRADLRPLAGTVADLARNETRTLVWWPAVGQPGERRLLAALGRARGGRKGRAPAPVFRLAPDASADTVRAALWGMTRHERLCVLLALGAREESDFPQHAMSLAAELRVSKLVLLHPGGGLVAAGRAPLSFVDENVLETLLRQGEAEWSGLGDRRPLLVAVREAIRNGVESVNVCAAEGIADDLFTYTGSGTFFTRGDYCHVAPLGIDDFAQAERLLERGQREGLLKQRTAEEIAQVLAAGVGASLTAHHLAGVAGLVTAPYARERAGEIVGLYTITRFKGEGIGERLVAYLVAEAERQGLDYVFACTVDERARQFFERLGFERVTPSEVPADKWSAYDPRRRARVVVLRRQLADRATAVL